jgi:HSP20 family protein
VKLFHRKGTPSTDPTAEPASPPTPTSADAKPVEASVIEPAGPAEVVRDAGPGPVRTFDRFNRLFDDWMLLPFPDWPTEVMHVDHVKDGQTLVVRAQLPELDPDHDIDLTVSDGVLWVDAHHRDDTRSEDHGYVRHEVRYGAFSRSFPLPDGVKAADISATFKDGVLEIRIPTPEPRNVTKVPITRQ